MQCDAPAVNHDWYARKPRICWWRCWCIFM